MGRIPKDRAVGTPIARVTTQLPIPDAWSAGTRGGWAEDGQIGPGQSTFLGEREMLPQAGGQGFRRGDVTFVSNAEAAPVQPADATGVVSPGDPAGPGKLGRRQRRRQSRPQGCSDVATALFERPALVYLGHELEFGIDSGRHRRANGRVQSGVKRATERHGREKRQPGGKSKRRRPKESAGPAPSLADSSRRDAAARRKHKAVDRETIPTLCASASRA